MPHLKVIVTLKTIGENELVFLQEYEVEEHQTRN